MTSDLNKALQGLFQDNCDDNGRLDEKSKRWGKFGSDDWVLPFREIFTSTGLPFTRLVVGICTCGVVRGIYYFSNLRQYILNH